MGMRWSSTSGLEDSLIRYKSFLDERDKRAAEGQVSDRDNITSSSNSNSNSNSKCIDESDEGILVSSEVDDMNSGSSRQNPNHVDPLYRFWRCWQCNDLFALLVHE